jgi:hypothetical protein
MLRKLGLILLGILLLACFVPVFSMVVIFPVTLVFGAHDLLYAIELTVVYLLSGGAAVWIIARLWKPKVTRQPRS